MSLHTPSLRTQSWQAARLLTLSAVPILVAAAWVNSHFVGDWLHYYDPTQPLFVWISSTDGRLRCGVSHTAAMYDAGWDGSVWRGTYVSERDARGSVGGFHFVRWAHGTRAAVPYWFLAAATAMPAGLAWAGRLRHLRARRRLAAGLCPACGYDLCATPDRCPECGTTPAA